MPAEVSHFLLCSSPVNENISSEIRAREVDVSSSESICCLLLTAGLYLQRQQLQGMAYPFAAYFAFLSVTQIEGPGSKTA